MALNNLGSAKMELGRIDEAEIHLTEATKIDGAYPIPYYNLAIIAAVRNDNEQSKSMYSKAEQLGFSQSGLDQAITRVAAAYAQVQSLPN